MNKGVILVVEDRIEEQQRAREAVEAAGYEVVIAETQEEAVRTMASVDAVITDMFFPPSAISDDTAWALSQGWPLEEVEARIEQRNETLPFCERVYVSAQQLAYLADPPQCGLIIVIAAQSMNKPVFICTDGTPEGHHGIKISWIYDSFVRNPEGLKECPFGWDDLKNWGRAVQYLEKKINK